MSLQMSGCVQIYACGSLWHHLSLLPLKRPYQSRRARNLKPLSLLSNNLPAVPPHDVVCASYVLREVDLSSSRDSIIRSLWAHTSGVLVIVEPGTRPPCADANSTTQRCDYCNV
jgi:hypothetical protein